ncbi:STAS domain-containing protein [Actinoplanes sp. NPDC051346]|uniref:STAS domain-containing protein n=1 Tax=Actinoplanes sp. NPDC051346 TaxID=3155048 RepID=UPI00343042A5
MQLPTGSGARSVVRIALTGDLDEVRAGGARDIIIGKIFNPTPRRIELDLSEVASIDSSALRALVACHQLANIAGSRLVIVDASPAVRKSMWGCGLSGLFS